MNRLTVFLIIIIFAVIFTRCKKEELACGDFCLYSNVENFHKTAPLINEYLSTLPKNWSDEQKVQAFVDWLNSKSCISIGYQYTKPKEVVVTTSYNVNVSTEQIFEFINLFDHKVTLIEMYTGAYTSNMPSSCLQNILDNLNTKPYVKVHGYLDGRIVIIPWLHNMENKSYQADWLKAMSEYNLYEWNRYTIWHGFTINFEVIEGMENEWKTKFEAYEIVQSVGLGGQYQSMR